MEVGCAQLGRWIGMFDLFRILKSLRLYHSPRNEPGSLKKSQRVVSRLLFRILT